MFQGIPFYGFTAVLLAAALGVIFARNPVHSVMCLVLAFFNSAALWLLIEAEFLAIVLVLVYVGAVMVLFLFVVMMLDINVEEARRGLWRYAPFGLIVAAIMVFELIQIIWYRSASLQAVAATELPESVPSNTKALGGVLYTEHVYAFELAAVVLLLAIVAAIALTMRKRPNLKAQDVARQVAVDPKDRVRIVSMEAEESS
ncbi:MAG: NADH-quinone oxidoreductase subunit J [Pseudomonadota bacterium]